VSVVEVTTTITKPMAEDVKVSNDLSDGRKADTQRSDTLVRSAQTKPTSSADLLRVING
jgi:hypothetical protein